MSTDVYDRVPADCSSPRMKTARRIDIVSVCLLVVFAVVAVVALHGMHPPRSLDETSLQRVQ